MAGFDTDTLRLLQTVPEVTIRTEKHPDTAVILWVVVAGDDVYVRSVRGTKGRWYQDLKAGGPATVELQGRRIPVQAIPATDASSVKHASGAYRTKYRGSPYASPWFRPTCCQPHCAWNHDPEHRFVGSTSASIRREISMHSEPGNISGTISVG
jgi:hypothetical protein